MRSLLLLALCLAASGCSSIAPRRAIIRAADAPQAIGPYSQAVRFGNMLFCSGQIAIDPATGKMTGDDVTAQTRRVMANLSSVLDEAGFSFGDVVQAQVFLADLNDYAAMNAVYAEFFPANAPARAAVQVARLPLDARVEIMVTAVRD